MQKILIQFKVLNDSLYYVAVNLITLENNPLNNDKN